MSTTSLTLSGKRARSSVGVGVRLRRSWLAAAGVFLLTWAGLIAAHHSQPLALSAKSAIAAVSADRTTGPALAKLRWTRTQLLPVDRGYETVWFYEGARLVFAAVVTNTAQVAYQANPSTQRFAYGSNIANDPRVLVLLGAVFVLMCAVLPLWRLRNLDVLVTVGSTAAIVLLDRGYVGRMALLSGGVLAYLIARCAWQGLGRARAPQPAVPLYDRLTSGWSDEQRLRVLRLIALAAALGLAMIGISSLNVVDVGRAVMEGATDVIRGVLPYGHVPGILHGDTYPIGSYLLYAPFAALTPVRDGWDTAYITLWVTVAAALLGAVLLWRATRSRSAAALKVVISWLTFPALLVSVSTGTTDVVLAVMLLGALLLWREPRSSTTLLAAGAWFKLMPVALLPIWLARLRGRKLFSAVGCIAGFSALMIVTVVALFGAGALAKMAHAIAYQVTRTSPNSVWAVIGSVPLQQLVQTATLALIVLVTIRARRDRELAESRTRMAAVCAAVVLALELAASYWTYMYLSWVFPLLALSLLAQPDERAQR